MDCYYFKNFTYSVRRYNDPAMSIAATLMRGERFVAALEAKHLPRRGLRIPGDRRVPTVAFNEADPLAFERLQADLEQWVACDPAGTPYPEGDRLFVLLVRLAQSAYYHRRAQQLSLKHTVYRLRGDVEGDFRLLRDRPWSPDVEADLVYLHRDAIAWIYRSQTCAPGHQLFEDPPVGTRSSASSAALSLPPGATASAQCAPRPAANRWG